MKKGAFIITLILFVLLSLSHASEYRYKYHRRHMAAISKLNKAPDAETQTEAKEGGAAKAEEKPPAPIKIDKIAILTPEIDVEMSNKPQIIIQRTKQQVSASELEHHKLKVDDPCTLRQGYVLYAKKVDESGVNPILYATPSFCVLNKKTISFFDSENVHTLMASYELQDVIANSKENFWKKSNCIPLLKSKRDVITNEIIDGFGKKVATFCLEDELQTADWIKAVNTFHKCTLEEYEPKNIKGQDIVTKIKRGEMEDDEDYEARRKKELSDVTKAFDASSESSSENESHEFERMSKELMEEFRRHKEMEAKERARLREERKRINEKAGIIGAQARCIEQALQVKSVEDEKTLEQLLDQMKMDKERNIWRTASKRLEYMWKLERENMHSQEDDLKKAEYEIQQKMKRDLIQETAEWTKNLDPYDCYNPKITGGNIVVMKATCSNMIDYGAAPDLKKFLDCLNPKKFCNICCGYYIGSTHEDNRIKCEQRCKPVMLAEGNAYNVDYKKVAIVAPFSEQKTVGDGAPGKTEAEGKKLPVNDA